MNILMVTPQLPYPLIDASKQSVFYPIKYLSERGHRIHVVCLMEQYNEVYVESVKRFCAVDVVVSPKEPNAAGAFRGLFNSTPYEISRFHNPELMMNVRRALAGGGVDLVHVEGIHAAFYGLTIKEETSIPAVMRMQNVHWLNLERMIGKFKNPLLNAYLRYETRKVRRYEAVHCGKFDRCLTISQNDTDVLLAQNPSVRCTVVPLRAGSGVRLKLLEMMAMKKAVVSTSVGCEGLGIRDEEHLLVADESGAFADGVVRLLRDPINRDRLGGNGQAFVREHFSWKKIVPQYENVYFDVVREHGRRSA